MNLDGKSTCSNQKNTGLVSHWLKKDWYDGLSNIMINIPYPKMLFTLSKDRLDEKLKGYVEWTDNM